MTGFVEECVVVHAGTCEAVSALKFPANPRFVGNLRLLTGTAVLFRAKFHRCNRQLRRKFPTRPSREFPCGSREDGGLSRVIGPVLTEWTGADRISFRSEDFYFLAPTPPVLRFFAVWHARHPRSFRTTHPRGAEAGR